MVTQERLRRHGIETVQREAVDPASIPLPGKGPDQAFVAKVLRNEKFAYRKPGRLDQEKFAVIRLGDAEFPRRNVDKSQREAALPDNQSRKIVVLLGVEIFRIENEAGVTTRTTSRFTTPLASFGSSICSQTATLNPFSISFAM